MVAINNDARNLSLQIALLVPLLAGLLGLGNSFRMMRLWRHPCQDRHSRA